MAWVYVHGKPPVAEIDHKDRDVSNDAIENLREATPVQNSQNKPGRSKRGLAKGVTRTASGKFGAQIGINGRLHWLGSFDTMDEAHRVYAAAARAAYGEFPLL